MQEAVMHHSHERPHDGPRMLVIAASSGLLMWTGILATLFALIGRFGAR